jgi:hypothetical protein
MGYSIKKASSEKIKSMLCHVKRFDSGEFITVLEKFEKHDYIVYGANGNHAVCAAIRAVKMINPSRNYITRAINKTHRVVIRL